MGKKNINALAMSVQPATERLTFIALLVADKAHLIDHASYSAGHGRTLLLLPKQQTSLRADYDVSVTGL